VEHDISLVMRVCEELSVLDFGQVIAQGPPSQIREDEAVLAAYLGSAAGDAELGEVALETTVPGSATGAGAS
jgi:branched-chain amino acid transport system ATP-binding protein